MLGDILVRDTCAEHTLLMASRRHTHRVVLKDPLAPS